MRTNAWFVSGARQGFRLQAKTFCKQKLSASKDFDFTAGTLWRRRRLQAIAFFERDSSYTSAVYLP